MIRRRGTTMLLMVLAASTAGAHHSLTTVYDNTRRVSMSAVVVEFQFVHPHPYLTVDGDVGGATARWRLDLDNRAELETAGMDARTFRPGDRLTAVGAPGRQQPLILYVRELERPADGLRYEQFTPTPRLIRR